MKNILLFLSLILVIGSIAIFATGCKKETVTQTTMNSNDTTINEELVIEDLVIGDGDEAKTGDTVSVHYTGMLTDGTVFDSSVPKNRPFEFQVGAGYVIKGWDEGVPGMKIGGKRKLTIPSSMGYGKTGVPMAGIPGNATLVFEVELLDIL